MLERVLIGSHEAVEWGRTLTLTLNTETLIKHWVEQPWKNGKNPTFLCLWNSLTQVSYSGSRDRQKDRWTKKKNKVSPAQWDFWHNIWSSVFMGSFVARLVISAFKQNTHGKSDQYGKLKSYWLTSCNLLKTLATSISIRTVRLRLWKGTVKIKMYWYSIMNICMNVCWTICQLKIEFFLCVIIIKVMARTPLFSLN